MSLPEAFQFSQANLQDFVACARRFQLRYLMGLRWPAAETEPIEAQERRMELGQAFHRLVQQWALGLPESQLARYATDPDLQQWWQNALTYRPIASFGGEEPGAMVRTEYGLLGRIAGYRLVAHYDVLITLPSGSATILDWKTSSKRPQEPQLRERLQSRVYPFLLVQAGRTLNGGEPFLPAQVEMVYWFPEHPHAPARLSYSATHYEADGQYLARLVEQISQMGDEEFALTDDEWECRFCVYRSYCGRGERAGAVEEMPSAWELVEDAEDDLDLDFDQIAEVAF
jgi:hypothetical protein